MSIKHFLTILLFLVAFTSFSQKEEPIRLQNCNQNNLIEIEKCFIATITEDFNSSFKLANHPESEKGFSIIFLANKSGNYDVLYLTTKDQAIQDEVKRVFNHFPKFKPATYNNHPIDKRYILPYNLKDNTILKKEIKPKKAGNNLLYNSNLNIPLTLQNYRNISDYEFKNNIHTAVKPYIYQGVSHYINFDSIDKNISKDKNSWLGRKLWDENMLSVQSADYWFHLDPVIDLQIGKENDIDSYTFNNTRGIKVEGGLGEKFSFSSSIFESQGRFATYFNHYALFKKPSSEADAIVPSRDTSKGFKEDGFDYPMTTGYVSVSPLKFMNIQFGHDKNFIGEGYRSLFISDVGAPYTFVKINTSFWKIRYTNLWTWLRDVNTTTADDEPYKRKYMAIHYLSWNATKNLNIGLFESVTWAKTPERGFDPHYLNPVIIYRALEYANGSRAGNAVIGLSANYRLFNQVQLYSQFLLDELTMEYFLSNQSYFGNKYGFQLGAKYHNAFKIKNLKLRAEYNQVRPYTYSHSKPVLNYGHVNQPLAHLWESNFKEFTAIASYQQNRWFGSAKIITGTKGLDYNSETDAISYGGDIFKTNKDKTGVFGVKITQGNKATILIGELQAGYLINPATNLKLFGSIIYRDFKTPVPNNVFETKTTTWFNIGLRTDINNWYFDF